MWFLWGFVFALVAIVLWYGIRVIIKTKGRYSPVKFWRVMWQVFRLKFFLAPQLKKLKNEGAKVYVTPELICYLESLLVIRFEALKGFNGIDEVLLYLVILDIPNEQKGELIDLYKHYQKIYNSEEDLSIDYYFYDIKNEYNMNRHEAMSFYYLNKKLARYENYKKHTFYIVVDPEPIL